MGQGLSLGFQFIQNIEMFSYKSYHPNMMVLLLCHFYKDLTLIPQDLQELNSFFILVAFTRGHCKLARKQLVAAHPTKSGINRMWSNKYPSSTRKQTWRGRIWNGLIWGVESFLFLWIMLYRSTVVYRPCHPRGHDNNEADDVVRALGVCPYVRKRKPHFLNCFSDLKTICIVL